MWLALNLGNVWTPEALTSLWTLEDVGSDVIGCYRESLYDPIWVWENEETAFESGDDCPAENCMRTTAVRQFDVDDDERDFKLGEDKNWAVGFTEISGPGAFSDIMTMTLNDYVAIASGASNLSLSLFAITALNLIIH